MSWRRHLRPGLSRLRAYDAPQARAKARLHANECSEPWPDSVVEALGQIVVDVELGRYPDTSGRHFRAVLGERHDCDAERIILGNGSDEIIFILLTALSGAGGAVVIPSPTFVMYGHTARVLGMPVREVALTPDFRLDGAAMRSALEGAAVCFLARPNNPTAALYDAEVILDLVAHNPDTIFVVDEAYVAYAPGESLWRPDNAPNMVHMSTLSKVGLAAIRVGYCVAGPVLAEALNKVRHPYNVSQTSLAVAEAVLTRFADHQAAMVARTIRNRTRLAGMLAALPDAHVYPSAANFVLARVPNATRLCERLAAADILVKDCSATMGLTDCLRVTVGTSAELDLLEDALYSAAAR